MSIRSTGLQLPVIPNQGQDTGRFVAVKSASIASATARAAIAKREGTAAAVARGLRPADPFRERGDQDCWPTVTAIKRPLSRWTNPGNRARAPLPPRQTVEIRPN